MQNRGGIKKTQKKVTSGETTVSSGNTAPQKTKPVKKITPAKKIIVKKESPGEYTHSKKFDAEKIVMENFIGLQKVMTNLAEKIDSLSGRVSDLLNLFEVSAKSLAERGGIQPRGSGGIVEKRLLEKVDNLLEQNRTIARGISLLHEPTQNQPQMQQTSMQPKQPSYEVQTIQTNQPTETNQYQKSISSKPRRFNPLPQK